MYPSSCYLPYSQKYWRELNLAIGAQIKKILVDLNLAVRYGICHKYNICKYEILAVFNLAVTRQTAKLPNFRLYGMML